MKIKKIIQIIILSLLLYSCGTGLKDALQGKKRSENSDEFLVQKKNPLVLLKDLLLADGVHLSLLGHNVYNKSIVPLIVSTFMGSEESRSSITELQKQ